MKSGTSRRAERAALSRTRRGRRVRAAGATVGALAALGVALAPSAAAYDAQSKQWYLEPMQAEHMWKTSTGKGVKVAVIDTGVNADTPSLKGQVLAAEVPASVAYGATRDYDGHGTTMAELIAGTGADGGLKGLAPGAKIVPYRVLLEGLNGTEAKKTPEPWQAIRAAADTDAKIISMSIGGVPDPKEEDAIDYAASKGKLLVAAAGNAGAGDGQIDFPAAFRYVIGVSSMNASGEVSKFSSHGGYVDLTAPGEGIPGWCDARFRSYCDDTNGTSPATAIASASAALIWSAHPDWTVNQVTRSLIDTAGRSWAKEDPSTYLGYGAVRPKNVLASPHYDPGPANVDPLAKEDAGGKGGNLLAESAARTAPAASAPASTPSPPPHPATASGGQTAAAGASARASGGGSGLWIGLGAAVAVVVVGGGALALLRARRAR
ncbi:S8 family serine peptidase [Streptomyces sp. NPDC046985]|uniref:S8 family serine peptidase n=1 Tax=Streptomyces sp. NPDC046985 TaxID=3155377 RepID=UPI0033D8265C